MKVETQRLNGRAQRPMRKAPAPDTTTTTTIILQRIVAYGRGECFAGVGLVDDEPHAVVVVQTVEQRRRRRRRG